MHKTILIAAWWLLSVSGAGAQVESKNRKGAHFQSYNALGLIAGANNTEALIQTVNGIRFPKWFVGAGAGIDAYRIRSVPLFLDARMFPLRSQPFFVYGNFGWHVPWVRERGATLNALPVYSGGGYYDGGLGYQLPVGLRSALVLSAGFTEKRHAEETQLGRLCLFPPCPESTNRYDYKLRRLSFKIGVMF